MPCQVIVNADNFGLDAAPSTDGLLEIVAHPNQLGADFGDACLDQGESLSALLELRLPGIPRVAYSVVFARAAG